MKLRMVTMILASAYLMGTINVALAFPPPPPLSVYNPPDENASRPPQNNQNKNTPSAAGIIEDGGNLKISKPAAPTHVPVPVPAAPLRPPVVTPPAPPAESGLSEETTYDGDEDSSSSSVSNTVDQSGGFSSTPDANPSAGSGAAPN